MNKVETVPPGSSYALIYLYKLTATQTSLNVRKILEVANNEHSEG